MRLLKRALIASGTFRCYTRKQNRDYADFLLTALYHESKKLEKWETLKERKDHLKVEFAGSTTEQRVLEILTASATTEKSHVIAALSEGHLLSFGL